MTQTKSLINSRIFFLMSFFFFCTLGEITTLSLLNSPRYWRISFCFSTQTLKQHFIELKKQQSFFPMSEANSTCFFICFLSKAKSLEDSYSPSIFLKGDGEVSLCVFCLNYCVFIARIQTQLWNVFWDVLHMCCPYVFSCYSPFCQNRYQSD